MTGWHRHRHRSGLKLPVDTTSREWGLLLGHQRGPHLATSGDFPMAMDIAVSCGGGEAANRVSGMRCRAQRAVRDLGRRAHVMTSAEVRSAISSDVRSAMSSDVRSAISAEVRSAISGGWPGQRRARDLPRLGGIDPPQPTPSPFPNRPALTHLVACGECKQPFASVRCVAAFTGGVAVSCGGGEAANRVSPVRHRAPGCRDLIDDRCRRPSRRPVPTTGADDRCPPRATTRGPRRPSCEGQAAIAGDDSRPRTSQP